MKMYPPPVRMIALATALFVLSFSSCTIEEADVGFAISLVESGEVVLSDEHIASYVLEKHVISLTPEGVQRWKSFDIYDDSHDPPIKKLGELTGKEFVVTIAGEEMYRGHFWSMTMSLLKAGVLIYDTAAMMDGELWVRFESWGTDCIEDPRGRSDIIAYFREQGKLENPR